MTADNFDNTLATFQQRTPFRPFTIVMNSGERFEVDGPRTFVFRDGVGIFIKPGGIPVIFDHEGVEHFVGDLSGQTTE